MPAPTSAIGAEPTGRFSTIAKACATVSALSPASRGIICSDRYMMPNAARPRTSSGWREFLRVIKLSVASTADRAPRPSTQRPPMPGTPRRDTLPTTTQGRNALAASATPATSGMKYARMPGRNIPRTLIFASLLCGSKNLLLGDAHYFFEGRRAFSDAREALLAKRAQGVFARRFQERGLRRARKHELANRIG